MATITGGHLIVRALKAYGVERVFTITGETLFSIYQGCIDEGMELIVARHEGGMVSMADGWSRATGKPSVVLASSGPGHSNSMGALSIAFAECSPVILLSAIDEVANLGRGGRQELPQVEMCAPITKWSSLLFDAKRIPEFIAKAFRVATNGMPGPVHISIAADALAADVDECEAPIPAIATTNRTSAMLADEAFVEGVLDLLSSSERPMLIAGTAAFWSNAEEPLREFIETTGLPLLTVEHARGMVPDSHPLCFGDGYGTINEAAQLKDFSDVIVILGERIDYPFFFGKNFGSAKIVHICPDPNELGKNRPVDWCAAGDVSAVLEQLLQGAKKRTWRVPESWIATLRDTRREQDQCIEKMAGRTGKKVHPARVALEVERMLPSNGIVAFDGGNYSPWARYCMTARRAGGWLTSSILMHLGTGLPYAIGAKLAFPDAPVVVLTGDGALGFSVMEFETAVRHKLPIVVVVANDSLFGVEVYYQQRWYGADRVVAAEMTDTRWDLVAEAMGAHGEFVETAEQLKPALERAFACGKPACVNVATECIPSPQTLTFSRLYLLQRAARANKSD